MHEAREFTKGKRFSFQSWWHYSGVYFDLKALATGKESSKANRLLTAGLVIGQLQASGT